MQSPDNQLENFDIQTQIIGRIKELIHDLRLNQTSFGEKLGYTQGYLSKIFSRKKVLTKSFLFDISEKLNVRMEWLLSGISPIYDIDNNNDIKNNQKSQNLMSDVTKSINKKNDIGLPKLSQKIKHSIPYYNVEATAGQLNVFNDGPETPDYQISIPAFSDCDFAVNLAGHSMYPRFYSGDIIICKRLKNLNVIPLGEVYLIVTDEQRLVKYLKKATSEDRFLLASENPKYEPFEVYKEDIKQLYLVKGKIERNQI